MNKTLYLRPDWPALANIRAYTSTRQGGFSQGNYESFNLAAHVEDDSAAVAKNRAKLHADLALPGEPLWLNQVHGITAVNAANYGGQRPVADASFATKSGIICAVLTADCLPVLLCDRAGTCVAAAHAGWRGLAAGVIEATIKCLPCAPENLLAWLGPAIGPQAFEVGTEVRDTFLQFSALADAAFSKTSAEKWLANIYMLATQRLQALGITQIYGGNECTFIDQKRFYSFRRQPKTGRMASLIWMV